MKKIQLVASLLATSFVLCGCDSVKHTLGLKAYQPDEGNIQKNPPLVQPALGEPEFIKLRPPRPGQKGAGHEAPQVKAQKAVGTTKAAGSEKMSASEKAVIDEVTKDED